MTCSYKSNSLKINRANEGGGIIPLFIDLCLLLFTKNRILLKDIFTQPETLISYRIMGGFCCQQFCCWAHTIASQNSGDNTPAD